MNIKEIYNLAKFELFPICRSITGEGVRKTLRKIKKRHQNLKFTKLNPGLKLLIGKFRQSGILNQHLLRINLEIR